MLVLRLVEELLVVALGGEVICDEDHAEVGTFDLELTPEGRADPLFSVMPDRFLAQEGHKDRARQAPSCTVNLVRSEQSPHQALRVVGTPVYATQFHPELGQVEQRLRFERYMVEYGRLFGERQAREIFDSIRPTPATEMLLGRFVDHVLLGRR